MNAGIDTQPRWRRVYWVYAAVLPFAMYAFEALKITSYETTRAPNVSAIVQLLMMLAVFGLWVLVPRAIWSLSAVTLGQAPGRWPVLALRLAGLAAIGSVLHLALLAFLLRVMHSPPGWGISHMLASIGEVWLGNAGVWLVAYGAAVGLIVWRLTRPAADRPRRLEVRHNGKALLLPVSEILWVRAAGNYSELITERGTFPIRKTLSQISVLVGPEFLRAHRSALINGRYVRAVRPQEHGGGFVVQIGEKHEAPLSRRELTRFKRRLRGGEDPSE